MSSSTNLPPHLMALVIDELLKSWVRWELPEAHSLRLLNKQMSTRATSALYSTLVLPRKGKVAQLLRTLAEKADIARSVRKVIIPYALTHNHTRRLLSLLSPGCSLRVESYSMDNLLPALPEHSTSPVATLSGFFGPLYTSTPPFAVHSFMLGLSTLTTRMVSFHDCTQLFVLASSLPNLRRLGAIWYGTWSDTDPCRTHHIEDIETFDWKFSFPNIEIIMIVVDGNGVQMHAEVEQACKRDDRVVVLKDNDRNTHWARGNDIEDSLWARADAVLDRRKKTRQRPDFSPWFTEMYPVIFTGFSSRSTSMHFPSLWYPRHAWLSPIFGVWTRENGLSPAAFSCLLISFKITEKLKNLLTCISRSSSTPVAKTSKHLPYELEQQIFVAFALDPLSSRIDIRSMLVVCKRVKSWIEPILYHTLTVESSHVTSLLFRTLRINPSLGLHIRTLLLPSMPKRKLLWFLTLIAPKLCSIRLGPLTQDQNIGDNTLSRIGSFSLVDLVTNLPIQCSPILTHLSAHLTNLKAASMLLDPSLRHLTHITCLGCSSREGSLAFLNTLFVSPALGAADKEPESPTSSSSSITLHGYSDGADVEKNSPRLIALPKLTHVGLYFHESERNAWGPAEWCACLSNYKFPSLPTLKICAVVPSSTLKYMQSNLTAGVGRDIRARLGVMSQEVTDLDLSTQIWEDKMWTRVDSKVE